VPLPLLSATQLQTHGPVPVTAVGVPALHRFVVGALVVGTPLSEPHTPCRALAGVLASIQATTNSFQIFICTPFSCGQAVFELRRSYGPALTTSANAVEFEHGNRRDGDPQAQRVNISR
jgi:hypothetical protein